MGEFSTGRRGGFFDRRAQKSDECALSASVADGARVSISERNVTAWYGDPPCFAGRDVGRASVIVDLDRDLQGHGRLPAGREQLGDPGDEPREPADVRRVIAVAGQLVGVLLPRAQHRLLDAQIPASIPEERRRVHVVGDVAEGPQVAMLGQRCRPA
jgi:hypothetical protein